MSISRYNDGMRTESKSGSPPLPTIVWTTLGIGLGTGGGFAIANIPNWVVVSGYLVWGVTFGVVGAIVQAHRFNRQVPATDPSLKHLA